MGATKSKELEPGGERGQGPEGAPPSPSLLDLQLGPERPLVALSLREVCAWAALLSPLCPSYNSTGPVLRSLGLKSRDSCSWHCLWMW